MRLSFAALLSLLISPALAHDGTYMGVGGVTCSEWILRGASMPTKLEQEGWIFGYASGVNAASPTDFLLKADSVAMLLFVDTWCAKNPDKKLVEAANELLSVLKDKSR
ncbi:MAG: hypothetical protein K2X60_02900 [Xanthobacteraceae bacterium]|nr:hypothetical protein [Xanthobacteraceae bacterium]